MIVKNYTLHWLMVSTLIRHRNSYSISSKVLEIIFLLEITLLQNTMRIHYKPVNDLIFFFPLSSHDSIPNLIVYYTIFFLEYCGISRWLVTVELRFINFQICRVDLLISFIIRMCQVQIEEMIFFQLMICIHGIHPPICRIVNIFS